MSDMFTAIAEKVKTVKPSIVFPEGTDERILEATVRLKKEGILEPLLVGNPDEVKAKAGEAGVNVDDLTIYDPETYDGFDALVDAFVERRKGKNTKEQAQEILKTPNYFGTMLVYTGLASGLVSGAAHATGDTVRPALQIIKTKEGVKKTSGAFVMVRNDERYIFGDCAINIAPDASDMAETAVEAAKTARVFDIDPKVAMLSFSTKGSAVSPETEKVVEATALAKEKDPNLVVDGEFQFDAAFVPSVAKKKAPDSPLNGEANTFIFPSLEAGNIGYKVAQRLGGFEAIGPILQGLNQPVNDLSRGCNVEDVYKLSLITAMQGLAD
ncbi:phosphate acetyltransferase [Salisediminibacterium selenitireducens]|uniref:Phosphate acetyltransferase n=1 Tax=Bacillus selenitireducens (strain ATCC 700615 / DSM 15326 / MLS10) TaxID=439292 RepID=D6Y1B6_BACIE|nr:phosphate acetyltransferase [Salisediminibacterium selenitireducens]ADI00703.1 phosphate acetyltransferase [[Bacillus] selenitireducens MLS10]